MARGGWMWTNLLYMSVYAEGDSRNDEARGEYIIQ